MTQIPLKPSYQEIASDYSGIDDNFMNYVMTGPKKYDFSNYHYPSHIEDDEYGHYILFNINVTKGSKFEKDYNFQVDYFGEDESQRDKNGYRQKGIDISALTNTSAKVVQGTGDLLKKAGGTFLAKGALKALNIFLTDDMTDEKINAGITRTVNYLKESGEKLKESCRLVGNTRRLVTSIALYMPENLETKYSSNWTTTSLSSKSIDALKGIGGIFNGDFQGDVLQDNVIDSLGVIIDKLSPFNDLKAQDFLAVGRRTVRNPHLEFMFEGISNREFSFNFEFIPKNEHEVELVYNIIKQFKFHAAPEIKGDSDTGSFFLYPSEFDISFRANGKENKRINKISTCVLKDINVLYSADGGSWTTFRPDSIGSSPTHIKLTLGFTETELITKELIDKGY